MMIDKYFHLYGRKNDVVFEEIPKPEERHKQGRSYGKWIISVVRCPYCLEYFDTDAYGEGELDKCPCCGKDMERGRKQDAIR